jgi:orotate phosphoribosyltransferase
MGGDVLIPEADRAALLGLLRQRSLRTGDFVLASGARSSYYIDARMTTMSGPGLLLIGRLGLATIDERGWRATAIGGLTLGADPVAYAVAHAAATAQRSLDAFTVRKEPKTHGTGRVIEGNLHEGSLAIVVEDVVTTGDSALRAIDAVTTAGAVVLGVLTVVDREQGGRQRIEAAGHQVATLFTATQLLGG